MTPELIKQLEACKTLPSPPGKERLGELLNCEARRASIPCGVSGVSGARGDARAPPAP